MFINRDRPQEDRIRQEVGMELRGLLAVPKIHLVGSQARAARSGWWCH